MRPPTTSEWSAWLTVEEYLKWNEQRIRNERLDERIRQNCSWPEWHARTE